LDQKTKFLPILGYGERLIHPITRSSGGEGPQFPRTYEQARQLVKQQINVLKSNIRDIPAKKRMREVVATVRLNSKFLAKSYIPNSFFRESNMENIGSRRWVYFTKDSGEIQYSKLHFIKVTDEKLNHLNTLLDLNESSLTQSFKEDIQKIENLSLLAPNEAIQGFDDNWNSGKVEIVLHPFHDSIDEVIYKLKQILAENGVITDSIREKSYPGGPTFISANINRQALQSISDFNPLRTVHPIKVNIFPEMRAISLTPNAPNPPVDDGRRSRIKVGMFDGGVDVNNPFLKNFVNKNKVINTQPLQRGIEHGNAVAGAILYGPLNNYNSGDVLPQPLVSVESFRVLPLSDPSDIELYEAIDIIENVVPARNDIDIYNLSFGPCGPILDDDISRFTYSLDRLAWDHKKLFIVAVGNDGDLQEPLNRIQAPSDIVNGLGVGAFSYDNNSNEIVRAYYSCIGDGREGCKVKPDISAFGGDYNRPVHLVSSHYGQKVLSLGTSYAAPIVSGKAGEILARCDRFNSLVARALLIHSARHPRGVDRELGYGIIDQSVEEMFNCCTEKEVTVVYINSIQPANYAKLPIPFPLNANCEGNITITWTIAVLTKNNPLHIEDYTDSALEDTFYPNDQKFSFSKNGRRVTKHLINDADEINQLLQDGWTQSSVPVSKNAISYQTELARRQELKWDTVVKRFTRLRFTSLRNPFLVLHGLSRNGSTDRMDYTAIVTISAPGYQANMYEDVLAEYGVLEPVRLRAINEILVQTA